ncbi:DUF4123 domain-containing protein [Paracoccus onubensis]|uniref:DUF4123 domain-containing protein n=1 Tax=Paracoccus onubensis TaxID=1675788 RepID=UPI00273065C7|nr:DUF4123 domain-containing protein [Paracoccus onubensis]MDP0925656.1 DUF4123 domain-containing protein [Paracoccus onubensis]
MDDPWQVPAGGFSPNAEDGDPICIETIENVEPLDRQFGISPKKTVPDVLREVIFGQPEPTQPEIEIAGGDPANVPSMQTYAILDAAKVTNLPELLGASGLEHRCLFKGNAYDDLKDVAPWLVRLEEGNDFTRRLFTGPDGINGLWDKEPGIYVRSRGILDEIFRHFRKFTRLRDKKDQWRYFRFWDPEFFTIASMFAKAKRCDVSIIMGRTITLSSVGNYVIDPAEGRHASSRDREEREIEIFN